MRVANIFKLAGYSDADAQKAAKTVMEFETVLAKVSFDKVTLRDPKATDHKMSFAEMHEIRMESHSV